MLMQDDPSSTAFSVVTSPTLMQELAAAAQLYFDLLYTCDVGLFDQVFDEGALMTSLQTGKPEYVTMPDYRERLRGRVSPQSLNAVRREHVMLIDLASPTQAIVKTQAQVMETVFRDYLIYHRTPDGWRVVAKSYHRLELSK
jgi:hypothetical protein